MGKLTKNNKAKALKRNLKSQMIGQIFIYILSLILIGFILIYGYNAIVDFRERAKEVSFANFENDLSSMVEIVAPDTGTIKTESFEVPAGYGKVCFVKSFPDFPTLSSTGYPLIENTINKKVKKNVFLIKEAPRSFFIGNIEVISDDNKILCIDAVNGIIKIKFEGKGDNAVLSKY